MNDKRNDADEASFEDLVSFETLPPPPGHNEGDVHNARTTVAALPDSFLDSLKAAAAERVDSNRAAGDLVATRRAKPFEMPPGMLPPPPASAPVLEAAPVTPRHAPRPAAPELPAPTPREPGVEQPSFSSDQLASAFGAALETRASEPRVDAAHAAFPPVLAAPPAPPAAFSAPPFSAPPAFSAPPGALSSAPGALSAAPGARSSAPGPVSLPLAGSGLSGASDAGVARGAPRSSRKLLIAAAVAFLLGMGILFALAMLRRRFM